MPTAHGPHLAVVGAGGNVVAVLVQRNARDALVVLWVVGAAK